MTLLTPLYARNGLRNDSTVQIDFYFERQTGFFLLQIYTPLTLIVFCSWVSFWLVKTEKVRSTFTYRNTFRGCYAKYVVLFIGGLITNLVEHTHVTQFAMISSQSSNVIDAVANTFLGQVRLFF